MRKLLNSELNRISLKEFKETDKQKIIIVLDNIRSLYNIGSVFRTSDAFKVEAIYLCGITGKPPHPEIHKSALGATDSVEWKYFAETTEAVKVLTEKKYKIYAIEQVDDSIDLKEYMPEKNEAFAYIFGNEIKGVSEEVLDKIDGCIEIPQFGTKHSFNIAVSAGIVLWHHFINSSYS